MFWYAVVHDAVGCKWSNSNTSPRTSDWDSPFHSESCISGSTECGQTQRNRGSLRKSACYDLPTLGARQNHIRCGKEYPTIREVGPSLPSLYWPDGLQRFERCPGLCRAWKSQESSRPAILFEITKGRAAASYYTVRGYFTAFSSRLHVILVSFVYNLL